MPLNSEISYVRLNDQDFEVMVALYNQIDPAAPINKPAIVRLVIEEDFRQWWTKGYLVFDNKHNAFERPSNDDEGEDFTYKFRDDGNDLLIFRLRPVITNMADDIIASDTWSMEFIYSVYDIQDITDGINADTKYKKLFFWDYDYAIMLTKRLSWSTAEVSPVVENNPAQLIDSERRVQTGDAIKHLLTKALPHKRQEFDEIWDAGASKINYVAGSNETANDLIEYLLKRHVSSEANDPCFLSRGRFTKKWVLQSLSNIFTKAVEKNGPGEYQIEHFFLDSLTELEPSTDSAALLKNPAPYKTPVYPKGTISLERDINLREYSIIKSYEFVTMAAMDNMLALRSMPVYSNDIGNKQFNLDFQENEIVNVKEYFTKNYVNKLKHPGCDPDALFTLNSLKNDVYSLENVYSLGDTNIERYADARNEIIKAALLLNQCIVFRCKGMTFRRPGRFIGIDREIGSTQNEFDNRLCGQWFVINVKHIMVGEAYVNEITAVKIHATTKLAINKAENYTPTI